MAWIALELTLDSAAAVVVADALLEAGAVAVDLADASAGTVDEQSFFADPGGDSAPLWKSSRIVALFAEPSDIDAAVERTRILTHLQVFPRFRTSRIDDRDWVRLTQSQFDPIRISDRLWIVPSWHAAPDTNATTVAIDPGVAFGTGAHATTHLCLQWLAERVGTDCSVIDYGCGSGILAIAAAKLGAAPVIGVDIDPQALAASRYNAQVNGVDVSFVSADSPLSGSADIVIANILSSPLIILAPLLAGLTRPGGSVVLSGILSEQADAVSRAYEDWFDMQSCRAREGWARLEGIRRTG